MFRRAELVGLAALFVISGLFAIVPQQTEATSGSFTIDPGETLYVSFGNAAIGDVLLWQLTVDTWSSVYSDWLQSPDGTHLALTSYTWGRVADAAGEWKLGFSIDPSGVWSATVTYSIYNTRPYFYVTSPVYQSYTNSTSVDIVGYAYSSPATSYMWVSTDDGLNYHLAAASMSGGDWAATIALGDDGWYSVKTQQRVYWGGFSVYYTNYTNAILKDTVAPDARIVTPSSNSWVRSPVDVEFQCSDDQTSTKWEVKVDALGWLYIPLTSNTGDTVEFTMDDGPHTVQVRITDLAGNAVVRTVTFSVDSAAPQVSIISPDMKAKLTKNDALVTWSGTDSLSGIDHYELQITGGQWINVGTATSYEFTGLDDVWYSVNVKAVDKSGNTATSAVSFGIYTSIWDTNGPYQGMPMYAVIAAAILGVILSTVVYWRRKRATAKPPPQEPPKDAQ